MNSRKLINMHHLKQPKTAAHTAVRAPEIAHHPRSSILALDLLSLQYAAGNQAVTRLLATHNANEQEAERVAHQVMNHGPTQGTQAIQSLPSATSLPTSDALLNQLGSGVPLPPALRTTFEGHLGYDLGQVRIHSGIQAALMARALKAQAFTTGNAIVFGNGKYQPNTTAGKELLAHELTHVVQQSQAGAQALQRKASDEDVADYDPAYDSAVAVVMHDYLEAKKEAEKEQTIPVSFTDLPDLILSTPSRKPTLPGFTSAEEAALRFTNAIEPDPPRGGRRRRPGDLDYGGLTGNIDDKGLSFGLVQWNMGGSLQPLLRKFLRSASGNAQRIFGAETPQLSHMLQRQPGETDEQMATRQLNFAIGLNDARNNIIEPWKSHFEQLARDPAFQQIELEAVRTGRRDPALREAQALGLHSQRGLAMMFDIVTQHGPAWRTGKGRKHRDVELHQRFADAEKAAGRELTENERLVIIANFTADMSKKKFRERVRQRRMTIATGSGRIHGTFYDLARDFGITEDPF